MMTFDTVVNEMTKYLDVDEAFLREGPCISRDIGYIVVVEILYVILRIIIDIRNITCYNKFKMKKGCLLYTSRCV